MNWKREGSRVRPDGEDIWYSNSDRPNIRIVIQKRHTPRNAGRPMIWLHTSVLVIIENSTLRDAKELAELIAEKS